MAAEVKHPLSNVMNQSHAAKNLCPGNRFMIDSDNIVLLKREDEQANRSDSLGSLLWSCDGQENGLDKATKDKLASAPALETNPGTPAKRASLLSGASNYATRKDGIYCKAGGNIQRRSIFGSYWKKEGSTSSDNGDGESDTQSATSSKSSHEHRRPSSTSALPCVPGRRSNFNIINTDVEGARDLINVMMFSPPLQHKSVIMSRFEGLEDLPPDIHMALPSLPSPLRRTYRSDGSHYSGGVYPLNPARSIMRKSTYKSDNQDEENEDTEQENEEQGLDTLSPLQGDFRKESKNAPPMVMPLPLALTDSVHLNNRRRNDFKSENQLILDAVNDADSSDDSGTSSSQTQSSSRVRFDPRVTITEYHDELPRQWYSDTELDKFKVETILLAQQFLKKHPELVAEFCTGKINPITGSTQKKALYSLPVLNDVSVEGESTIDQSTAFSEPSTTSAPQINYPELARTHVQRVLIVDPNKLILDLFCKSVRQIFPHAELVPVQTGYDALLRVERLFQSESKAFDLIIVEERLDGIALSRIGQSPPLHESTRKMSEQEPPSSLSLSKVKHNSMTQLEGLLHASTEECPPKLSSGSEVIGKIKQLEENQDCVGEVKAQDPGWLQSLKIGVCVDQKKDTLKLWQGGADMVWGKPPPPMGENLRNQLVAMLVQKRSPAATGPC